MKNPMIFLTVPVLGLLGVMYYMIFKVLLLAIEWPNWGSILYAIGACAVGAFMLEVFPMLWDMSKQNP